MFIIFHDVLISCPTLCCCTSSLFSDHKLPQCLLFIFLLKVIDQSSLTLETLCGKSGTIQHDLKPWCCYGLCHSSNREPEFEPTFGPSFDKSHCQGNRKVRHKFSPPSHCYHHREIWETRQTASEFVLLSKNPMMWMRMGEITRVLGWNSNSRSLVGRLWIKTRWSNGRGGLWLRERERENEREWEGRGSEKMTGRRERVGTDNKILSQDVGKLL